MIDDFKFQYGDTNILVRRKCHEKKLYFKFQYGATNI